MLRRSLLDEVGLFDESLPACEDYDLWLRISCRYPVNLIQQPLVVKEGGHPDQLSARYRGMDRFRIQSIEKLIKSGILNKRQQAAAAKELSNKCRIYGNGCLNGAFTGKLPYSYQTMYAPANTTVILAIQSTDVVHSWWVPSLGGKVDAVPGYTTYTWFKAPNASTPGHPVVFHGQCAQLCGRSHAAMTAPSAVPFL